MHTLKSLANVLHSCIGSERSKSHNEMGPYKVYHQSFTRLGVTTLMKDGLIDDGLATVQHVVHEDDPCRSCRANLSFRRRLRPWDRERIHVKRSWRHDTYDLDMRVNLKTSSASIDVRDRANTEALEGIAQQRNFGNYHATFKWDWAPQKQ